MTLDDKDPRSIDAKKLHEHGIEMAWKNAWLGHLSDSIDGLNDVNQERWRLSRLSFLAGYLHARSEKE